jgi:Tfp pilus assembly protein PilN
MKSILAKIFSINEIQVVSISQDNTNEKYSILLLKKNKNKLETTSKTTTTDKSQLISLIDCKKTIILVVSGKGILNKKIDFSNEIDLAWQKNIDYDSVYFTNFKTEKCLFISFCRKNIVDDWLTFFKSNKIEVIDFYIGDFTTALIANQINKNSILSNTTVLTLDSNSDLVDFKKSETSTTNNYKIGNEEFDEFSLLPYAVGIHFFIKTSEISKSESNKTILEEQLYKKSFNTFGIILLIGFFVALLVSFFGIQHYASKNAELNIQNVYANKAYQQIVSLEQQKKDKETIINGIGLFSEKFLSFYVYDLSKSIPSEIILNEISVNPINKEIKNREKVEISAKKIEISGTTLSEEAFNFWLKNIKELNWLQKLEIVNLKKDKKNNTYFTISIWIK